jgi:hypothetical protein
MDHIIKQQKTENCVTDYIIRETEICTDLAFLFDNFHTIDLSELLRGKKLSLDKDIFLWNIQPSGVDTIINIIKIIHQESTEYNDDEILQWFPIIVCKPISHETLVKLIDCCTENMVTSNHCEIIYKLNYLSNIKIACDMINYDFEQIFSYGITNYKFNDVVYDYLADKISDLNIYNYDYIFCDSESLFPSYKFVNTFINNGLNTTKLQIKLPDRIVADIVSCLEEHNLKKIANLKMTKSCYIRILMHLNLKCLEEFLLCYNKDAIIDNYDWNPINIERIKLLERYSPLSISDYMLYMIHKIYDQNIVNLITKNT